MKIIRAYSTRIEVEPYELGENIKLERMCSTKYDKVTHTRDPIGFRIEGNKFIGPRGLSLAMLSKLYDAIPTMEEPDEYAPMKKSYGLKVGPRDEDQKRTISFLLGLNEFQNTKRYSQLALTLATGKGKTYCATFAIIALKVRTIVILHRDTIKEQWLKTFEEKTGIDMNRVCVITGTKMMLELMMGKKKDKYDIYLIIHQTLSSYIRQYGAEELRHWFTAMKFGLKVVDEAHLCFRQTIETDLCSNVAKNFYLTATFTRSDYKEVDLYNTVFANTMRFGQELERVKNVVYELVYYNSAPSYAQQGSVRTSYGLSAMRWSDYAFERDKNKTIYQVFFEVLKEAKQHEGKILIVIPKIEYCERMAEFIKEAYPNDIVGTVHSKQGKKRNEEIKETANIIVTTISSMGTGSDILGIRSLIIMEPYSSVVTAQQLTGRLREYAPGEESYAYELVDIGFRSLIGMIEKRYKTLQGICKKIKVRK